MGGRRSAEDHARELEKARTSAEQLEILLRRSETGVRRSIGIEALERFAGEIAAYFKGLLEEVSGYGRALQKEMDYRDPSRAHVRSIIARAEAGKRVANKLLTFSEGGRIDPVLVDINRFVRDLTHLVSGTTVKSVWLRTMLTNTGLTVMADPARLGQAFVSLVKHAAAFVTGGGTMTVRTDLVPVANSLVAGQALSGCALLSIRSDRTDSCPSSDQLVPKRPGKEIHLGLPLIRRIIQEHRGAFRIAGQKGKTLEFNIYLPVFACVSV
jgi:signal transduction histidine kinase